MSLARPARAALTHTPAPERVTASLRFGTKLTPQRVEQAELAGLCAGQQQRVHAQHGGFIGIRTALPRQHVADAPLQLGQRAHPAIVAVIAGAQPLWQRHLQQVAAGMRGQPRLQVRIDAVDQVEPGGAVQVTPLIGMHGLAGKLRLHAIAREQQVERRGIGKTGRAPL